MAKINTLNYQTVAAWNGSQDLFVVEQPDGTKVATPEQVKQYVLNDMDEVPTQNSNNPVKSGGIFSTMAVPKYDSANRREYYEGGAAFDGNIDSAPTAGSNNAVASGGVYTALTLHDNAKVQQLNIYKANNVVSIYGLLNNLDSTQTIIAYATLDAKYRPASGYAVGALISTTAPYLPVGSVWVNGSTGAIHIYKEAARTDGYFNLTYLT